MNIDIKRKIEKGTTPEELVKTLLIDRNIENVDEFLKPKHPKDMNLEDFFEDKKAFKKDWGITTKELAKLHKNGDMIVVYMDYDADGITGGATLWQTLHALGFNAMPHIPDRKKEGYGLSKAGIDLVKEKHNPKLIISVDHGIVAHDQIAYAKKEGINVIITDHHQKKDKDPKDALAIFHTAKISGSGVAYFFAKAVAADFDKDKKTERLFETDFLAFAAIGTIADLVPLTNEARSLAKYGLEAFTQLSMPGLPAMLEEARINPKSVSTYHVGFMIGPRINAFGRIKHGMDALRLLCTNDNAKARKLAVSANVTNKQRQDLVTKAVEEANNMVNLEQKLLIVYSENWEEGITGLIAGKLMQRYNRPAIVITNSGDIAKASVRSLPNINIISFLREIEDFFIDLGGHPAAAGFSIKPENIEPFKEGALDKANEEISQEMLQKEMSIDMEMPFELVTLELAKELQKLEPFGIGNKSPLFIVDAILQDVKHVGKNGSHAKLLFKGIDAPAGKEFSEGIYFNGLEKAIDLQGHELKCICAIEVNEWNGKESLSLKVVRLVPMQ